MRVSATVAVALAGLLSCASPGRPISSGALPRNAVAYVDTASRIHVVDMDTDRAIEVSDYVDASEDAIFAYPTWSPSTDALAFVGVEPGERGTVYYASGGTIRPLYSGAVSPFYLSISDSGEVVGVLGSHSDGGPLALLGVSVDGNRAVEALRGRPLYWDWIPGGSSLMANVGNPSDVALVEIGRWGAQSTEFELTPSPFRVPAVSRDGTQVAYAFAEGESGSALTISDIDGRDSDRVMRLRGVPAFSYSPAGDHLAVFQGIPTALGVSVGPVTVLDTGTGDEIIVSQRSVGYYWSPDGTKLAYLEPVATDDGTTLSLILSIYYVEEDARRILYRFRPSPTFLQQVLPFFDQYQRSTRFWSPDSSSFLTHALTRDGEPGIYVVPISDSPRSILVQSSGARLLAEGLFATWSFR
mgnify:FL=1